LKSNATLYRILVSNSYELFHARQNVKKKVTLTYPTGIVLQAISRGYSYGFEIMDASGLPDGTVYPALRRLEFAGCLLSEWEDKDAASAEARPPRRYYRLTPAGEEALAAALSRFPGLEMVVPPLHPRPGEA
jgi:DNA-binding MarR family transcriptional regulator